VTALRADVPLSSGDVAKLLGWPLKRTVRWLDGLAEKDPSIIVRVRGRRRVTLASLRRVCPELAKHFATDRDVEEIRDEQAELKGEVYRMAAAHREFQRKSWEWFRGLSARLATLEKLQRSDGK
jgi:hypothetical protein